MGGFPRSTRRVLVAAGCAASLILVGCTSDDPDDEPTADTEPVEDAASADDDVTEEEPAEEPADEPAVEPASGVTVDDLPDEVIGPECEDGPDRTITHLPDIVIPEVVIPAVVVDDFVLPDGEVVPGFVIPEQIIDAQLVDGGCIIEHHAPGGCLGMVEITEVTIPDVEIPDVEIPPVVLPDGSEVGSGGRSAGGHAMGAHHPGVQSVEERCQQQQGDFRPEIFRGEIFRGELFRGEAFRGEAFRGEVCIDGACIPPVVVPPVVVPPVVVAPAVVPAAVIEAEVVAPDVDRFDEDDRLSYVAPADILFDFDSDELRGEAEEGLQAIVDDLSEFAGDRPLLVEGHTDDVGTADYNLDLSLRRAQRVADWLADHLGISQDRIEVVGHGLAFPAASNDTEEGRAQNRRVVISTER
jgi:outer membrane protein OmpA-like peptidoglycan-associated protein